LKGKFYLKQNLIEKKNGVFFLAARKKWVDGLFIILTWQNNKREVGLNSSIRFDGL
jgi:hypothetical protein